MKTPILLICILTIGLFSCKEVQDKHQKEYTIKQFAPFENLDTIATNDWWNRGANPIIDVNVPRKDVIAFGLYTVSNNTLKLSAQLFPLYPDEDRDIHLEVLDNNSWERIQTQSINDIGWSALFRVNDWNANTDKSYRLRHGEQASYEGLIRKDPINKNNISLAALSCNSNKDRGDRAHYIRNINAQNPDDTR